MFASNIDLIWENRCVVVFFDILDGAALECFGCLDDCVP